ncbi:MAG: hypothetical protein FJX78_00975 [Armatimonadetes bacterium]|nr:hypothetical protein [Armatimonadota bacterium]
MIFERELIGNIMPFAHAANAVALADGTIAVTWYCGSYEGAEDQRIAGAERRPDGTWTDPHLVLDRFDHDGQSWNPETSVPIVSADGTHHLLVFAFPRSRFALVKDVRTYFVKPHRAGFDCTPRTVEIPLWYRDLMVTKLFSTRMVDHRATALTPLPLQKTAMVFQGRALKLQNGQWAIPYHRREGTEMRAAKVSAGFLLADDGLTHWEQGAEIFKEPGCSEPAAIQWRSGEVLAYMRRAGLTRTPPPPPGDVWTAISRDGCRTFTEPVQTNLRNPDSGSDLYLGRGERLVVAFNDSYVERFPLCVGISDDGGVTYRARDVESSLGVYAYPKLLQSADGLWHLFYSHNYACIVHAWFDEEWIESGRKILA